MLKRFLKVGMILMSIICLSSCAKTRQINAISPIVDNNGADPSILKKDNTYYYTKTTGNNIIIYKSDTFTDLFANENKIIYEAKEELKNIWAPEIFYLDNSWYIYFAANTDKDNTHHMYVLSNSNEDIFSGEWILNKVKGLDDKFAIDGTVFEAKGERYFIWSGWEGYENVEQNLYLAQMKSPIEVYNEKILISKPEYEWEKQGIPLVNEGPEILIKDSTINLVYSASGSWTDDYCLGLITANINDDLKDSNSWKKEDKPILESTDNTIAPGHNTFVNVNDKTLIVYHSARWLGGAWSRNIRFDYLDFDENGKVLALIPSDADKFLDIPDIDKTRYLYTYKDFSLHGDISIKDDENAKLKKAIYGFLNTTDTLSLKIKEETEAKVIIYVYVKLLEEYNDNFLTDFELRFKDKTYVKTIYPSKDYQVISYILDLEKGDNVLEFASFAGASELAFDRLELSYLEK